MPNTDPDNPIDDDALRSLARDLRERRVMVLTGAGCSTDSGIPDYRDRAGEWKRAAPVQFADFVRREAVRRRYWARSMHGWLAFARASPGPTHRRLAALEAAGHVDTLVTQNVDGLHTRAGHRDVIDLHGTLDRVECLDCGEGVARADVQRVLEALNPRWSSLVATIAPDGDADLSMTDAPDAPFRVPDCDACGGMLKPSVVFFGENVPRDRVARAFDRLASAELLLVVGSSLMVFSGYRFVREAKRTGKRVAIVNLGRTRGDDDADLKIESPAAHILERLHALVSTT